MSFRWRGVAPVMLLVIVLGVSASCDSRSKSRWDEGTATSSKQIASSKEIVVRSAAQPRHANSSANRAATSVEDELSRGIPPGAVATAGPARAADSGIGQTKQVDIETAESAPIALAYSGQPPAQSTRFDERRANAAGIRQLVGKHITLYTDLESAPAVDELPAVFDAAIEPWCEYFHVSPRSVEAWKVRGCVMQRRERFIAVGLLPEDLPQFLNGYAQGGELWVNDQPSDYYRRHLLLHEGTHAFMQATLHGMGPPWYSEGIAELMGTHLWKDGKLQLRYFPRTRDEVPHWGRIKIVETEYEAGRGMSIEQVTDYGPTAHLRNEPYGWCWAATAFLDGHPQFAERFRRLPRRVDDTSRDFSRLFHTLYQTDDRQLEEQWQLFVVNLDYGYDLQREAIVYESRRSDQGDRVVVDIRADRGWQSTGFQVAAGTTYVLRATGRYQVAQSPRIWWCEPCGVTIRYYGGHPLGMLLAGVSDQSRPLSGVTPLARPEPIGGERELQFADSGTLFLRINDSPAELADNAGQLRVEIAVTGP